MESDLFTSVDASILGSEEPGLLLLNMRLREEGAEQERRAIETVTAKVDEIMRRDITPREPDTCHQQDGVGHDVQ